MILFKEVMYNSTPFPELRELVDLIIKNCTEFVNSNSEPKIFRGMREVRSPHYNPNTVKQELKQYYIVEPSSDLRKSHNTENYYTLYIDNAPEWSMFPKREIICTTSKTHSSWYGSTYVVVPFDGAKFGVCPDMDIWDTFENRCGLSPNVLFELFRKIANSVNADEKVFLNDTNFNVFKQQMLSITKEESDSYQWNQIETLRNCQNLYEYFQKIFSPQDYRDHAQNFKVAKYSQIDGGTSESSNEVWTDAKCILLSMDTYEYLSKLI